MLRSLLDVITVDSCMLDFIICFSFEQFIVLVFVLSCAVLGTLLDWVEF